jgi:hypothetical protein
MTAVDVQDKLGAAEADETLLSFAITIAQGEDVPKGEYKAVHKRLFESPTARRAASKGLRRYSTPDLLWGTCGRSRRVRGHGRYVATLHMN